MGLSFTTIKNLTSGTKEYPPGCIQCPSDYKPGNPGTFENLHSKFDSIETKHFEGVRLCIRKILSTHFQVTHTISMNPKCWTVYNNYKNHLNQSKIFNHELPDKPASRRYCSGIHNDGDDGYKFGVSYTGLKKVNQERYPQLCGDIRPNGDLTASISHTLGCRLRLKVDAKIRKSKYDKLRTTLDYRTDDFTITAALVNPSILKQEGVLLLQYLQSITTRLAMGIELALTSSSLTGRQTNLAGAFRYSTGFQTFTATVGESALRVCYHHKQSQHLQMGAEFQSNFVRNESKAKILYQVAAPMYNIIFRGFVDSNFLIGGVFEKSLYPIPEASLILSALFDHTKSDISVGLGVTIG